MNTANPRAESIFAAALEIADSAARRAYLDRQCAGNATLRNEVESLLVAHTEAGTFLDGPAASLLPAAEAQPSSIEESATVIVPVTERSGDRIGRYKLLEQIGEGGFGVVWMAEQEEPVRRRVALKIIKLGMDTREAVARFEAERQALALMDHPNIARVFDGGATDRGRPYFVMELLRGVRITDFCEENKLSIRERLELFMQVCVAVQHAHQKGIIHRDLKPSNALVSIQDDRPVPKVIDFGIAKATAQRLTDKTVFTRFQQVIGTPAYMSPEQAGTNREDIDTRSDIYSLGVLLYELLTGKTPFETRKLLEAGMDAILKTIREEEPPKPSTRLTTLAKEELARVATRRRIAPEKLGKLVRGELDWIVMNCLEKDRTRRYETANGLASDVRHYLDDEPVEASPPGIVYLTGKLLRRRRKEAAVAALLFVLVVCAIAFGLQTRRSKVLRQAVEMSQFRREESEILNKVVAGSAFIGVEKDHAQACVSRLAERVKSGLGSEVDRELLARFLTRAFRLDGNAIQTMDHSSVSVQVRTASDYAVGGVGLIVSPFLAHLDGTEVKVDGFPVYLGGGGFVSDSPVHIDEALTTAGTRTLSCILEAQLVLAREKSVMKRGSAVRARDYQAIGMPVKIVLPSLDLLFLRQLPSEYPLEIVDDHAARECAEGLVVSDGRVAIDKTQGCTVEMEIFMPRLSPQWPIALRVDLVRLGEIPLRTWVAGLIAGPVNTSFYGDAVKTVGPNESMSFDSEGTKYRLKFRLPEIKEPEFREQPPSAQISIRSSREVAVRYAYSHLEHFLSFPEIKMVFPIAVEDARTR